MFCLDIETLNNKETAVVASAAILFFDGSAKYTYEELLQDTLFVKFNIKEQLSLGRTTSKSTVDWWKKQPQISRDFSLKPSDKDVSLEEGIRILTSYVKEKLNGKEDIVWTRGSLDQFCIDSLFETAEKPPLFPYGCYRDMRTAIDLLKETARGGYCDIPGFDKNKVWKHIPTHDVAYDVYMLLEGK